MSRIAGVAYVKVDGTQYALRGNLTVSPSPTERAGIAGQDGVHGFSENPRVPYIEGDFSLMRDLSVEAVDAIEDATVQAELANGKTYVGRNCWCKSALELNTHEGMMRARFESYDIKEI